MRPTLVAQLFPRDVVCLERALLPVGESLDPAEAEVVSRASAKRRREFAAGRALARQALRELGFPDAPLLMGDDRAPLWPSGVVGSISHTDVYCVAAVAKSPPYRSLGVDAEPDVPLEESLWPEICTARELNWLTRQPEPVRGLLCHVLFVLKECVYKYQSPITRTLLDFQDVEVTLDSRAQRFEAELLRPALAGFPAGSTLRGRFLIAQGLIVAALY